VIDYLRRVLASPRTTEVLGAALAVVLVVVGVYTCWHALATS
jgi:hypothetical protein